MEIKKETYESKTHYVSTFLTVPDEEIIVVIMECKETGEMTMPLEFFARFMHYESVDEMLATDEWLEILYAMQQKNVEKKFPLQDGGMLTIRNTHWKNPNPPPSEKDNFEADRQRRTAEN